MENQASFQKENTWLVEMFMFHWTKKHYELLRSTSTWSWAQTPSQARHLVHDTDSRLCRYARPGITTGTMSCLGAKQRCPAPRKCIKSTLNHWIHLLMNLSRISAINVHWHLHNVHCCTQHRQRVKRNIMPSHTISCYIMLHHSFIVHTCARLPCNAMVQYHTSGSFALPRKPY